MTQSIRVKPINLFNVTELGYEILKEPDLLDEGYYFSTWFETHGTLFQAIQLEKRIIGLLIFLIKIQILMHLNVYLQYLKQNLHASSLEW